MCNDSGSDTAVQQRCSPSTRAGCPMEPKQVLSAACHTCGSPSCAALTSASAGTDVPESPCTGSRALRSLSAAGSPPEPWSCQGAHRGEQGVHCGSCASLDATTACACAAVGAAVAELHQPPVAPPPPRCLEVGISRHRPARVAVHNGAAHGCTLHCRRRNRSPQRREHCPAQHQLQTLLQTGASVCVCLLGVYGSCNSFLFRLC